jgi:hypothetical protein
MDSYLLFVGMAEVKLKNEKELGANWGSGRAPGPRVHARLAM